MSRTAAKKHDRLVEYVAHHLKQRFYDDIRAHTDGFRPPAKVGNGSDERGFVPDVTMVAKGKQLNVLEVETPETMKGADTAQKWRALSSHVEQSGGTFWLVVPRGASQTAMQMLQTLELQAKVWEVEPKPV